MIKIKILSLIIMIVFFCSTIPKNVKADITSGLIAYYPFDEGTGLSVFDNTINHNDGTLSGVVWVDGIKDYAVQFSGYTDRLTVPDSNILDFLHEFTISFWFLGIGGNIPCISKTNAYFVYWDGSITPFGRAYPNSAYFSGWNAANGIWHHFVYTYHVNDIQALYGDGILLASTSVSANVTVNTSPLYIGYVLSVYCKSTIDEVKLYNRALSSNDVQDLYRDIQSIIQPTENTLTQNINEFFDATLFSSESYLSYISLLIILVILALVGTKTILGFIISIIVSFALLVKYASLIDSSGNFAYQIFIVLFNLIFSFIFLGLSKAKSRR